MSGGPSTLKGCNEATKDRHLPQKEYSIDSTPEIMQYLKGMVRSKNSYKLGGQPSMFPPLFLVLPVLWLARRGRQYQFSGWRGEEDNTSPLVGSEEDNTTPLVGSEEGYTILYRTRNNLIGCLRYGFTCYLNNRWQSQAENKTTIQEQNE